MDRWELAAQELVSVTMRRWRASAGIDDGIWSNLAFAPAREALTDLEARLVTDVAAGLQAAAESER